MTLILGVPANLQAHKTPGDNFKYNVPFKNQARFDFKIIEEYKITVHRNILLTSEQKE